MTVDQIIPAISADFLPGQPVIGCVIVGIIWSTVIMSLLLYLLSLYKICYFLFKMLFRTVSSDMYRPVERHGCQVENRCGHRHNGHEVIDGAVNLSKFPTFVSHGDIVEATVEDSHQEIRQTHICNVDVRNGPHVLVSYK